MQARSTEVAGPRIISPSVWFDSRGFFLEVFNSRQFASEGLPVQFVQDNHSRSKQGVLRGLYYQLEKPQGKLVSVIRGKIFDVAADIRRGSPTYGSWVGVVLDDIKRESFWVPPGFAHGFCTMSSEADVLYKCTDYYDPQSERGIIWNDRSLAIDWPIQNPLLSVKDKTYPGLSLNLPDLPQFEQSPNSAEL